MKLFTELLASDLRVGKKCRDQHTQYDGRNVRFVFSGLCVGCFYSLPPGEFEHQWVGIAEWTTDKYASEEDAKIAHSQRVMFWQKRNKEKRDGYVAKYQARPEVAEGNRLRTKSKFQTMRAAAKKPQTERTEDEQMLADRYEKRLLNQRTRNRAKSLDAKSV